MSNCNNCQDKNQACVPFFLHENAMMHYNRANHRMLVALIVSIVVIMIGMVTLGWMFLASYNDREKGWQEIAQRWITEVENGVYQQPDTGAD